MDVSSTMIKSIKITEKNYLDYSDFALKRLFKDKSKVKQAGGFLKNMIVWFVVTIIFMAIFQIKSINFASFHWQSSLITAVPFIIFIFAFLFNIKKCKRLSVPRENGLLIGNRTIELKPEGINEINSFGHSFYKWECVEALEENEGDIYIFVDKLLALIIPSEFFSTKAEKEELKALVQKYV